MAQPIETSVTTKVIASRRFGNAHVEVALGDVIAQIGFDAFIHPTNARMALDGNIGAAIRAKSDSTALAEACLKHVPLEKYSAVLTPVIGLGCPNVIHCRGPRYGEVSAPEGLRATYRNVLTLAEESGFKAVALPAVSAGFKGFTAKQSAELAMEAVRDVSPGYSNLKVIRFVLSDQQSADSFLEALMAPHQVSKSRVQIDLRNDYSVVDFQTLRRGDFGDQDSKWFFYYEEPWLLVYRGNRQQSSRLSFSLRLRDESAGSGRIEDAWAETWNLDALAINKEIAGKFVSKLLDERFGLLHLVENKETVSGVTFWVKYGNVVLDCSYCQKVLLPEEAEQLGRRLVEMSRRLGRKDG